MEEGDIEMVVHKMKKWMTGLILIAFVIAFLSIEVSAAPKTLIIGSGAEPLDLLPSNNSQITTDRIFSIYQQLVNVNKDARPVPCLATKWQVIDSNKKWRFHLRKGVLFHNGEKFTSEDVAFTIDYMKNPNNKIPRGGYCRGYAYEIIDDYTIDIFREDGKPVPPMLPATWYCIYMLPKDTVSKYKAGELARNPVGTGPFQFVQWKEGQDITLKAFDKYWGGKPKIDRVVIKSIPEIATRVTALKTGEIDIICDVPAEEVKTIEADPKLKIVKKTSLYNMMLTLRKDVPPFKDNINLRKAVAHAIDSRAICKEILGGYAIPVGQVNSPIVFGYNKKIEPYKYDPALAKKYLQQSGYKGEEIGIQSSTGRYLKDIEINTALLGYLKAVGINAKVNMYDWPTWIALENSRKGEPICLRGWADNAGDGAENLFDTVHSQSKYNFEGPGGIPGLDEQIDIANTKFNPEVRRKAIEKANAITHGYYTWGMNYVPIRVYGIRKNVKWAPRADETIYISHEDDKL